MIKAERIKKMENIAVLGSTGSIGTNALEIAARHSDRFRVVGLAAGGNIRLLAAQAACFKPKIVSLRKKADADEFRRSFKSFPGKITYGPEGSEEVSRFEANDIVVSAITGIDGLKPTMAAVQSGKKIALANKESMVVAGAFIQAEARRSGARIIPVDSEHSGVFQCLAKEKKKNVKKVILTASGGPFFRTPRAEIRNKTLEEALAHPRWKMGKKISVDSATLMNKGLELVEARWLFHLSPGELDVLVHPQSVVHSLVEMKDGSVFAQLGPTDMKIPIQYALTYPEREEALIPSLDLSRIRVLEFYSVDGKKFPLFSLARVALEEGESLPVALNAANEAVVEAFLRGRLRFTEIADIISRIVGEHRKRRVETLDAVYEIDRETRARTREILKSR
ncbi:MAG: 1-deoxy-D-xylulose-5-phosphate reductoisomerase [Acidobacteriota bacterium]|nr:1-deoxy-D-xylulose-5-phosphate reductoisomerase [Acidobacteriota bacterium]